MNVQLIHKLFTVFLAALMLLAAGGCAAASLMPSATPQPVVPTQTSTPAFTTTPPPTLTSTATPTSTPTASPEPTDTATPTPSLTPTRTLAYNLPGLYYVGRCMRFDFAYSDPAPGGTGTVDMCLATVQINKSRSMQFNFTWHLVSASGPTPNRYIYGNLDALTLTDNLGKVYAPISNSGKKPDRDENADGVDTTAGWYLFPAPSAEARVFTLHDDDGKSVSIPYISFITK